MLFEGKFVVAAPIEAVWEFLWDAKKMGACMPSVESIEALDGRNFTAAVVARVAYLTARFDTKITVVEVEPPRRLVAIGEGMDKRLSDRLKLINTLELKPTSSGGTEVSYKMELNLFGKLASLGHPIIKHKAKQLADEFARNLQKSIGGEGA